MLRRRHHGAAPVAANETAAGNALVAAVDRPLSSRAAGSAVVQEERQSFEDGDACLREHAIRGRPVSPRLSPLLGQ